MAKVDPVLRLAEHRGQRTGAGPRATGTGHTSSPGPRCQSTGTAPRRRRGGEGRPFSWRTQTCCPHQQEGKTPGKRKQKTKKQKQNLEDALNIASVFYSFSPIRPHTALFETPSCEYKSPSVLTSAWTLLLPMSPPSRSQRVTSVSLALVTGLTGAHGRLQSGSSSLGIASKCRARRQEARRTLRIGSDRWRFPQFPLFLKVTLKA